MKVCVSTVCTHHIGWQESFSAVADAGFNRIEVLCIPNWQHVRPFDPSPEALLAFTERLGLSVVALHSGGIDGSSEETAARDAKYVSRVIEFAAALGAGIVVCNGMPWPKDCSATRRDEILDRFARHADSLDGCLAKNRVLLGLENHFGCQLEIPADYERVVSRLSSGRIGLTLDTGHFTASGVDPAAMARRFGSRVVHVHVKDHIGRRSMGLGYGQTDNAGVIDALRDFGYAGELSVEMEVEDLENVPRYLREAHAYMQKLLAVQPV